MSVTKLVTSILLILVAVVIVAGTLHWTINRVYVHPGYSLQLEYKGPLTFLGKRVLAEPGQFAKENEIGVREQMRGPGRYFYCPLWWKRNIVKDVVIRPGEVGIVTSKLGDSLPEGEFLVDGDLEGDNRARHKGILRKVFGPGRYRANPYAFEFKIISHQVDRVGSQEKHSGWVMIPTGYVGVVTYLADNPQENKRAGIQSEVLPPGLYPVNPREQQVDIVEIGFRESSIVVKKQLDSRGQIVHDESGEPLAIRDSGISFPSNDGFDIQLDFTAIWGVMPKDAPKIVRTFGSIEAAESKVILPQSESICRNSGSSMGAVELLVGETRQQFQLNASATFSDVLEEKNLTLLYGLIRHIYIPQEVREPIQQGYIADELTLTREQETLTAKTEAELREAERKVELEAERTRVETEKLVASVLAEGKKSANEINADTQRQVAEIDKQIAEFEAQRTILIGQAEAHAQQLQEEARAQKFQLAVDAFGNSQAYNKWQFAEQLPESIDLRLFYAGEGTLWTDLKGIMPTLPLAPKTNRSNRP